MPKLNIGKTSLAAVAGILLLTIASSIWFTPKAIKWLEKNNLITLKSNQKLQEDPNQPSVVLTLATLSSEQRKAKLEEIASASEVSLERSRARYLLASDLLKQYEGGPALLQLEDLEDEYEAMAPYILLKRGRGYELTNENEQAFKTWQKLIETYPDSPIVAEALYQLGQNEPQYWDRAIAEYPEHPRTHDIIRDRLQKNPKQPQLMLILLKHSVDGEGLAAIRDRLVKDYSKELKPDDWSVIAAGYWEAGEYKKAIPAYRKATSTPESAYRIARGLQVTNKKDEARKAYQYLVQKYPDAEETGLGLRRLAAISPSKDAIVYLDRAIAKFPDEAPDALLAKAKILKTLNNNKSAAQIEQLLMTQYTKSDAAAEYRWQVAEKAAETGDYVKAWQWAQPITTNNPDSSLAPKAAFWVGKWAQRLGRQADAKTAFENVLARFPQSYYAWRSAVLLGWNVGDFNNVRQLQPKLVKPTVRSLPPAGSKTFQELYRLGLDEEAWTLFQAEVANSPELTVDQQFTEGLLKLAMGKNLQGINYIWSLRERNEPEDQTQWASLRQKPDYWYALFPFPYFQTILSWSQQRQLNPLLVTSLIRQESRFEPEIRSPAGAVGLMQVMPATGEWIAQNLKIKEYSLTNPQDNVKFGTWYLDHTHQEYSNNSLLAVASYNAGPGNVSQWRQRFQTSDPDVFVEKIPFPETQGYVESVFGNYWNYLRIYNPEISGLLSQYTGQKESGFRSQEPEEKR
jgi:soluble lytic murein transglycosylase